MAHLIDKDAVVAEIERLHKEHSGRWGCDEVGVNLEHLEDFLDTLEVKEVDLEKEIDDYMAKNWEGIEEDKHLFDMIKNDLRDIAKHFFKFGLCNTITEEDCKLIWNIGDEIPNMPEEEFFKELLKRYKAQKGE